MQIMIEIPNTLKEIIDSHNIQTASHPMWVAIMMDAIENGTPLPKGHGKLGDLDTILNKAMKHRESYMEAENSSYCRGKLHAYELYVEEVENAPTIIEADTESEVPDD